MTRTRSTTCWRSSRWGGTTLVEVVAAIAIMGTILVGVVLAKAQHTRQLAQTQALLAAVRAADDLIAAWHAGPDGPPIEQSGVIGADAGLAWSTRLVHEPALADLGARVLRVEVARARPDAVASERASDADVDAPLVVVDLVLPDPEWDAPRSSARARRSP